MSEVGIAVVGNGYWGKNHVRNFHALGALRVVVDRDEERLRSAVQGYPGVDVERNLASVLARPDVRGIVLATPAETHFRLARTLPSEPSIWSGGPSLVVQYNFTSFA